MRILILLCGPCVRTSFCYKVNTHPAHKCRRTGERKAKNGTEIRTKNNGVNKNNIRKYFWLLFLESLTEKRLFGKISIQLNRSMFRKGYAASGHGAFPYNRVVSSLHEYRAQMRTYGLADHSAGDVLAFVPGFYFLKYLSSQEGYYSHFSERTDRHDNVNANHNSKNKTTMEVTI